MLAALRRTFTYMRGGAARCDVGVIDVRRENGCYVAEGRRGRHESRELGIMTRWVQYHLIELLIHARDDLIWFHGAVAGYQGRAVLLPGPRGSGKSTIVSRLWARGWTFMTDDIMPLDPATNRVLPFPMLPAVRQDPGRDLSHDDLATVPKTLVDLDGRIERDALPLAAVVLPTARRTGETELTEATAGEAALALLEGCWNLPQVGDVAVAHIAELVPTLPIRRLTFGDPDLAADLVGEWAEEAVGTTA